MVTLSVGMSLVFDIGIAVLANYALPAIDIAHPLNPKNLKLVFAGSIIALYTINRIYNKNTNQGFRKTSNMKFGEVRAGLLFLLLPIFASIAAYLRNTGVKEPMVILLLLLSITPLLISSEAVSKRVAPIAIYCVALAVLYHTTLITEHLWGWDIHVEYYSALLIQNTSQWSPTMQTETIQLLMITLLSTTLSNLLGIPIVSIFKIVYPLFFALVPVSIYYISRQQFDSEYIATLAPFLLIFYYGFFKVMPSKQAFGELYLVLLLLVLLDSNTDHIHRRILGVIFLIGLVTSHYTVSLLSILFLSATIIVYNILSWLKMIPKREHNDLTNPIILLILSIFWVGWFTYTAKGVNIVRVVLAAYFAVIHLIMESSSARSGAGYASRTVKSVYWAIYMVLSICAVGFTGIGILRTVYEFYQKRSPTQAYSYAIFSLIVFAFLCTSVIAPFSIGFDRILSIAFVLVAPFAVYGFYSLYTLLVENIQRIRQENQSVIPEFHSIFALFLCLLLLFSSGAAFIIGGAQVPRYGIALSDDVDWPTYQNNEVAAKNWLDTNRNPELPLAVYNWKKRINSRDGLLISEIEYRHEIEPIYPKFSVVHNNSYFYMSDQPLWHKEKSGFVRPKKTDFYHTVRGNLTKLYSSGSTKIYYVRKGNYSRRNPSGT
ncbi:DUF2206 domain-containing protein (plasmid) [Haladaptatus sp. SPP-AMP-3]|uniref:DUF2206 domain-containing protein n=1 Tax=Haladaptatus sp. SPP-AMP-3 TaxID=3121295 RepID=UPI003C2F782E